MKTIKPLRLGVVPRPFEMGGQSYLVVTALAFFPLDAPDVLLSEQAMWRLFTADAHPPQLVTDTSVSVSRWILDEGLPKGKAEVMVRGHAYPAGGPQPGCAVRLVLGPEDQPLVDKRLVVSGDRKWDFMGMSMPEPFTSMPLDWEHAFGGPGFPDNPAGRGYAPTTEPDGTVVHRVPNVEYPNQRIKAKGDRPRPASFGPMDPNWPVRLSKMGTFDSRWLETEYPGMPSDLNVEAHNAAAEDQRIDGWWKGGEPFLLENMHPTRPRLEGHLPSLRGRAFMVKTAEPGVLHEIGMHLETVQLIPHAERGILVFRGMTKIDEDDAHDVSHVMVGVEKLGEPRPLEHYRRVFDVRTDREAGAAAALQDRDLIPELPRWREGDGDLDEMTRLVTRDRLLEKNMERRAQRDHARMIKEMEDAGLDPAAFHMPAQPPGGFADPVPLDDVGIVVKQFEDEELDQEERAKKHKKEAEDRARAVCEANGVDYDELVKSEGGGPPKFSARLEVARLREAIARAADVGVALPDLEKRANDPEFEPSLVARETQLKDSYRGSAHMLPPAALPANDVARELGAEVLAAHAATTPVADRDFTGADLRGASLAGADLAMCFLERANLEGADLSGADLRRAVLARADLRGAKLAGADLTGANLGEADLTGADLTGVDLTEAIVFRSKLHGARLDGATLHQLDAFDAHFVDVSLVGARLTETTFIQGRFERVAARQATFTNVGFLETEAPGLDLSEAHIDQLSFVAVKAPDASFRGARMKDLSILAESSFPRADFSGASMRGSSLRGTNLEGARFDGAEIEESDLSEVNARGARMARIVATGSVFMRTDLTDADLSRSKLLDANLEKARLAGASFEGANLFQADLAGAKGDQRTSFSGANLGRVRKTKRST